MFGQSEGYSYNDYQRIRYDMPNMESDDSDYNLKLTYGRLSPSDPELNQLIEVSGTSIYPDKVIPTLSFCSNRTNYRITAKATMTG